MPNNTPEQKLDSLSDAAVYIARHPGLRLAAESIVSEKATSVSLDDLLRREAERTVWGFVADQIDLDMRDGVDAERCVDTIRRTAIAELAADMPGTTAVAARALRTYRDGVWTAVLQHTGRE